MTMTTEKMAQLDRLNDRVNPQDAKLAQIYEWVKTGHISLGVFRNLIQQVIIVDHCITRELEKS